MLENAKVAMPIHSTQSLAKDNGELRCQIETSHATNVTVSSVTTSTSAKLSAAEEGCAAPIRLPGGVDSAPPRPSNAPVAIRLPGGVEPAQFRRSKEPLVRYISNSDHYF